MKLILLAALLPALGSCSLVKPMPKLGTFYCNGLPMSKPAEGCHHHVKIDDPITSLCGGKVDAFSLSVQKNGYKDPRKNSVDGKK